MHRPPIPYGWHYYVGAPRISTVLGLTFGALWATSLDYLYDMGYAIDGYYNNVIYLRDIPMLNYTWPDVMLNYGTSGGFTSAQFAYSSEYRNLDRFNSLYNSLCNTYGDPVESSITTTEGTVSWWGGEGQGYVTLSYNSDSTGRFYTYLSIGN